MPTKSRKSDDGKRLNRSRSSSNAGSSEDKKSQPGARQNGSMHSLSPKKSTFSGPVPRAPRNGASSSTSSRSQIQARDARVPSDSMGDFAQFIRATGPAGDNNIPSPLRTAAPPSIASVPNSVDTRRSSVSNRARLQARDATVDKSEDHSDLIDFIRRGPTEHTPGTHRIPRAVAPFRNTMDSDQLAAAVGGKAVDATIPDVRYSQVSTSATDMSPSMHSSINSQSALLRKKTSLQTASNTVDENEPMQMPVRKTRRVKDPYAIDFSDEEDEEAFATPAKPPAKKEESLAEFLMNYEPPPETIPAPPAPKSPARTKKKSSASNLINRFRGGSSSSQSNAPPVPPLPRTSPANSGKGFVPIQVSMPPGHDKRGPVDRGAPPRAASSAGGVPRKKYEAREPMATSAKTGTSDLAAFLKSSEPPPPSGPVRPAYSPPEEQGNAVSRMLGRRKKSMAA